MAATTGSRRLQVGAVTLEILHEPAKENLPRVLRWLERCASSDAQAVVFPECALGHYFDDPIPVEGAMVGALVEAVRALGLHVGIGFGERAGDRRYSSYLLVGPEGIVGHHRKTRWQTERCPIDLGTEVQIHLWGGIGTGVLVCSESWHPDKLAADLAKECVELLIVPAAVGPKPGEPDRSLYEQMLVANARSLGVPAVSVGAVGGHLVGGCMVVDRSGVVRYWQPSAQPEMHRFDLELPERNVL